MLLQRQKVRKQPCGQPGVVEDRLQDPHVDRTQRERGPSAGEEARQTTLDLLRKRRRVRRHPNRAKITGKY